MIITGILLGRIIVNNSRSKNSNALSSLSLQQRPPWTARRSLQSSDSKPGSFDA